METVKLNQAALNDALERGYVPDFDARERVIVSYEKIDDDEFEVVVTNLESALTIAI